MMISTIKIAITLVMGVVGYFLAKKMKVMAPGLIGSMIFVGILNAFFGFAYLPSVVKVVAQSLSGAFVGIQIAKKDIRNFRFLLPPFLLLIAMFTANTFVMGFAFHSIFKMDLLTALLGCVPGGVSDMSMLAMDMNADAGTVALMQTFRFVGAVLLIPIMIKATTKDEKESESDPGFVNDNGNLDSVFDKFIKNDQQKVVFTIIITLLFGYIGLISGFPAGAMVFAMFGVMLFNVNTKICKIPKKVKLIAQIMSGSVVGTSITPATIANLPSVILPLIILLASYLLINLLFTLYSVKKGYLDRKSAMFASAPGGATDMTLIAADLGADLTKIALIQVMRAAYILACIPPIIQFVMNLLR